MGENSINETKWKMSQKLLQRDENFTPENGGKLLIQMMNEN